MTPDKFKQYRKALGFTEESIAYELDTNVAQIISLEAGIKIRTKKKLINAFKLLLADSFFIKAFNFLKNQPIGKTSYEDK